MVTTVQILLRVLEIVWGLSIKVQCDNIHLGILIPIDHGTWKVGKEIIPIIGRAIQEVNNRGILPGYNITYTLKDSKCSSNTAPGITADLMNSKTKVNTYIGPGCSAACLSAGLLAHYWNVPMISFSCSSSSLMNRKKYSTFARTQPFSRTYSGVTPVALLKIMQHYRWKRVAIIAPYGYKGDTIWEPIANSVRSHFLTNNITVPYYKAPYVSGYDDVAQNSRKQMLMTAKSQARVIFVLANREQVSSLLLLAKELNMFNGNYAFITLDFYVSSNLKKTITNRNPEITNDEIMKAFNGIITLTVKSPSKDEFKETSKWLTERMTLDPSNPNAVASASAVNTAPYLHDAILLYSYALNRTLQDGKDINNGRTLFSRMRSKSPLFTGMSGPVTIDNKGNRVPTFVVENVLINDTKPLMELWSNGTIQEVFKVDTVWPGGGTTRPDDNPECVFIKCPLPEEGHLVRNSIITAMVVISVLFAFVLLFYYRKRKYEEDLFSKTWIISSKDITPADLDVRFASKVIRNHYDAPSRWSRMTEHNPPGALTSYFGRYKDEFVALKRLRKDTLNLTRNMLIEMKQVRDIVHVNLIQYIGVCLEPSNIFIVSQYCHRGSLQEILANDDIKLDWFFRASFANDICMGMKTLHASPIHLHGSLRSSNCLIDNRWVCKIADYGLKLIKANQKKDLETGNHASFAKLFWKAPELLYGSTTNKDKKPLSTQCGDVYSYGIILYELLTREEPYSAVDLSPRDVIARVCSRSFPPFRPSVPQDITNIPMINLMKLCWDDDPQVRPSFNEINRRLKEMHKGKHSIVDNMLRLMENYTDQLETIVEERTRQLAEEKKKTDELLYKMLPRPIAESLKNGQPVLAESYKSVTIFFSDIVGFTALAAASTPLQVVHFLNDLYIAFDTIIDSHNVYKVETIGDAYMVVSGLPVPNGNKHAEEIANMALNLLECSKSFKIRHFESRQLQLRIGMHTGPCVAGVVGIKMPRYCLFGDTVNYASRMESNGVANRIHVSTECKKALDVIGGWQFEERGYIEIKGKGTVFTYFLDGKELGEHKINKR
ncbi:atrial natriuretic peptide receptor 1-like [Actinia tenebrosa]|uniref:Guanylate cyclase n=1 Tax=Actinia tenebrosa TaxID=6105 RepID=A0A6P8IBL2_ACTTE|nr:atrial natriuretic peptide receptor 1-like [Actinia tenebrosa]XP_031564715.1 atrial natriuretic peptide receptor 1-like [Actinia tenebrosa]XP_031564716.1 atrial natriuretic peptide receptor 1-like [Actinia tenebrosa]XP_031564717.1 atrial natriuretic peptide receptor 1-like [Actinia tenebrosa]XP_031564718.1 atrial natriuretic peptide receptor 1-like [Actinia tenebrosa]